MTVRRLFVTLIVSTWACALSTAQEEKKDAPASAPPAEPMQIVADPAPPPMAAPESPPAMTPPDAVAEPKGSDESPPTWCDGLPVETFEEKWPDGKIKSRQQVVRNKEGEAVSHGLSTQMWESGEKKLEITFHCGVKHGPRRAWHHDGKNWSVGAYVNGRDDGTWTEWYADGTKAQEFTLRRGVWVGNHTAWHTNGKKRSELHYEDGIRQGPLLFWDEAGVLMARVDFADGVEQPTPAVRQND